MVLILTDKMKEKLFSARIFCEGNREVLFDILDNARSDIREYKKGELIYGVTSFECAVGLILKGRVKVVKRENAAVISILEEGEIFGCAGLFSGKDYYVNDIVALSDSKVIFIPKKTIEEIMLRDPNFSLAFIKYLSERLYYLNTRIMTFTAGTAENKVASYLLSLFADANGAEIPVSMSRMASAVDSGRASVYRAVDSLCQSGAIAKNGKTIKLISEEKLKKFLA